MEDKPLISPGSMLNTSEGLLTSAALTALVGFINSNDDWRVQIAACLGIAILAGAYAVGRSMVKAAEIEKGA